MNGLTTLIRIGRIECMIRIDQDRRMRICNRWAAFSVWLSLLFIIFYLFIFIFFIAFLLLLYVCVFFFGNNFGSFRCVSFVITYLSMFYSFVIHKSCENQSEALFSVPHMLSIDFRILGIVFGLWIYFIFLSIDNNTNRTYVFTRWIKKFYQKTNFQRRIKMQSQSHSYLSSRYFRLNCSGSTTDFQVNLGWHIFLNWFCTSRNYQQKTENFYPKSNWLYIKSLKAISRGLN